MICPKCGYEIRWIKEDDGVEYYCHRCEIVYTVEEEEEETENGG